jgi:C4-dicarboxylate-specific signal transduction histidine kinase
VDRDASVIEMSRLISGESSQFVSERRISQEGGRDIWCLINCSTINDADGNLDYIVAIFQDVDRAKHLQVNLAAGAKMVALGEMASGMAHEVNTPLGIIHGKASQILRRVRSGNFTREALAEQVEKIITTSQAIADIIQSLRTFSRDASRDQFSRVEVAQIIEGTITLCRERFKNDSVDLRVGKLSSSFIDCRPSQISQVLLNLLGNAFDAISDLPEKWVEVATFEHENRIVIYVTDSGSGITPEVLSKIMQPFFTTKEPGKGTGLGLSISRGLVEGHGGALWVDSTCANTRFVIELPMPQTKFFTPGASRNVATR